MRQLFSKEGSNGLGNHQNNQETTLKSTPPWLRKFIDSGHISYKNVKDGLDERYSRINMMGLPRRKRKELLSEAASEFAHFITDSPELAKEMKLNIEKRQKIRRKVKKYIAGTIGMITVPPIVALAAMSLVTGQRPDRDEFLEAPMKYTVHYSKEVTKETVQVVVEYFRTADKATPELKPKEKPKEEVVPDTKKKKNKKH